jgi:hypothetical protein
VANQELEVKERPGEQKGIWKRWGEKERVRPTVDIEGYILRAGG